MKGKRTLDGEVLGQTLQSSQGNSDVLGQTLQTSNGNAKVLGQTLRTSQGCGEVLGQTLMSSKVTAGSHIICPAVMETPAGSLDANKANSQHHIPAVTSQHHRPSSHSTTQDDAHQLSHTDLPKLSLTTCRKLTLSIHVLVALVMGQVGFAMSTMYGFPGIALPQLTDADTEDLFLTPQQARLFATLTGIGNTAGVCICGPVLVRLGQRTTMLMGILSYVVAWVSLALSPDVWVLLLTLVVIGTAYAFVKNSVATYTLEVTHEKYRGMIASISWIANYLGVSLPSFVGVAGLTWRQLALVCCGLNVLPIVNVLFLPNSPRWLVTRNRNSDARKALIFYRGSHQPVDIELTAIIKQVNSNPAVSTFSQVKLLFQSKTRGLYGVLILVTFLIMFTGTPSILAYLVIVMQDMNTDLDPYMSAVIFNTVLLLGVALNPFLIDKVGRKPLLIVPLALNSLCFVSIIIFNYLSHQYKLPVIMWLPFVSTILAAFMYGIYMPVYYTLQGEVLPTSCRAVGVLLLECVLHTAVFLANWTFPLVVQLLGQSVAFGVFSGCSALLVPICALALPETKGCSLEQITSHA